jgi:hypothetical protein
MSNNAELTRENAEWVPADDIPEDGKSSVVSLSISGETSTDFNQDGNLAKDIPKPERYQETVDTFTTVASNLSELAQVIFIERSLRMALIA